MIEIKYSIIITGGPIARPTYIFIVWKEDASLLVMLNLL